VLSQLPSMVDYCCYISKGILLKHCSRSFFIGHRRSQRHIITSVLLTFIARHSLCWIWMKLLVTVLAPSPLIDSIWAMCLSGGKRGDCCNCSVLYCELKLCTVISTLWWAVLTVLWIEFCHSGPISLCIDWFISVYFMHLCVLFCTA